MPKTLKTISLFAIILISFFSFYLYKNSNKNPKKLFLKEDKYKPVQSRYKLNEVQKKELELPSLETQWISVYRFLDHQQFWQTQIGTPPKKGSEIQLMGYLHKDSLKDISETAVYLCEHSFKSGKSQTLDTNLNCDVAQGKPISPNAQAIGYLSKMIRTGYLLMVRCRTPDKGIYLSLNSFCEDANHQALDVIGAIRAAEN